MFCSCQLPKATCVPRLERENFRCASVGAYPNLVSARPFTDGGRSAVISRLRDPLRDPLRDATDLSGREHILQYPDVIGRLRFFLDDLNEWSCTRCDFGARLSLEGAVRFAEYNMIPVEKSRR